MDRSKTNSQSLQKTRRRHIRSLRALFLILTLTGCATYQHKVDEARKHLENHEAEKAIHLLESLAKEPGRDQLIYLFDYATALQIAGQYKASSDIYVTADQMSDAKDYLSVSSYGGSLLFGEEYTQYKGDDFERLLIHVMSALNYLMLHDRENALVEIRRLNEKLEYFRLEEKKEYEQNTMAMYIGALLWEADRNWDSAYIDYDRVYKRDPTIPMLQEDLLRSALRAGRTDEVEKWQKKFGIKPKPEWRNKNLGEVVLIYQQGWGPRKIERPRVVTQYGFISPGFPALSPVRATTTRAQLEVLPVEVHPDENTIQPQFLAQTQFIYSVDEAASKTLETAYAPLIAKRIAAYITKEIASQQLGKKNEALGAVMNIAMHISDRADLRQWSTLPASFQVARIYAPAGRYRVKASGLSGSGTPTGEDMAPQEVEVRPGETVFLNWRSFK